MPYWSLVWLFAGQSFGNRNRLLWGEGTATCQRLCQTTTWVFDWLQSFHWLDISLTPALHLFLLSGDANVQISSLAEELARKAEDASRQQEEIRHLLSQIVDLQKKAKLVRRPCRIHGISFMRVPCVARSHLFCFGWLAVCRGERRADSALGSSQRRPATTHCRGKTIYSLVAGRGLISEFPAAVVSTSRY